jgi:hypothetical protein
MGNFVSDIFFTGVTILLQRCSFNNTVHQCCNIRDPVSLKKTSSHKKN